MSNLKSKGRNILSKKSREPIINTDSENLDSEITSLLQWYNLNKNKKDSRKYLIDHLKATKYPKKDLLHILHSDDDSVPLNVGWICRIKSNNSSFIISDKIQEYIDKHLQKAIKEGIREKLKKKKNKQVNVKSVRDYLNDSIQKILAEVGEKIDEVVFYETSESFDIHSFLVISGAKKPHVDAITDYLKKEHSELVLAQKGVDEEFIEAYSHLGKRRINFLVNFYEKMITDCVTYLNTNQNVIRKTRKKKLKTPEQITKKVKFQVSCDEIGLKSISPDKIIQAKELWVYNTKSKKLSHYISSEVVGLSVKGTTLLNFDSENSLEKTLRKPKEILNEFSSLPKSKSIKIFNELKTKENKCSGRLNEFSILIKIFK
jgi:hypothetical protein